MKLILATGNRGKAREIARVLKGYDVAVEAVAVEVEETRSDDVSEIARDKAASALLVVGRPLIVDDTGLFLEAYPGFPGALSEWVVTRIGVAGILRLLEGGSHAAHFKTGVAFAEPGARTRSSWARPRWSCGARAARPPSRPCPTIPTSRREGATAASPRRWTSTRSSRSAPAPGPSTPSRRVLDSTDSVLGMAAIATSSPAAGTGLDDAHRELTEMF